MRPQLKLRATVIFVSCTTVPYANCTNKHPTIKGKQVVYSVIGNLAAGRGDEPWKWAAETKPFGVANSWRTNIDIQGGFSAVGHIVACQRRLSGNGSWCPSGHAPQGRPPSEAPGFPCPAPSCEGKVCPGPDHYAGPGHFNDMDMLIVGTTTNTEPPFCTNCTCTVKDPITHKRTCTGCDGCARPKVWAELSVAQCRAHMSMWTILKSPLLASADLLAVNQPVIDVLANTEVLAVADDPLGQEAVRLGDTGVAAASVGEIYVGPMAHGVFAVVMFNEGGNPGARMTFAEEDLRALGGHAPAHAPAHTRGGGGGGGWKVRDLWRHTDNGTLAVGGTIQVLVPSADAVMFTLTPIPA